MSPSPRRLLDTTTNIPRTLEPASREEPHYSFGLVILMITRGSLGFRCEGGSSVRLCCQVAALKALCNLPQLYTYVLLQSFFHIDIVLYHCVGLLRCEVRSASFIKIDCGLLLRMSVVIMRYNL